MRVFGMALSNFSITRRRHTSMCSKGAAGVVLIFVAMLLKAQSSIAASRYDPLPVEQREAVDTTYPSAVGYDSRQPTGAAESISLPPRGIGTQQPEQSVQVNKPLVSSNEQWELYNQMQQMQEELQMLRGMLEQQAHELEQMKRQQRERYLDLDHRLGQLKRVKVEGGAVKAQKHSDDIASKPLTEEEQIAKDGKQYDAAYQLLKDRKFAEAIVAFQTLLAESPGGKKAPYCEYWLGELFLASDPADLDQAKTHFVRLLTQYPGHGKVPDGMYKLGTVFDKAGDKAKARVTLKRVIKDFAGSQAAKLSESYLKNL